MLNERLTTKQFAALCKVERRTLHYYDEIDLLKPVKVEENGYRIYNSSQFDTMSMIKALQSVGMSLTEIKSLMSENDLSRCKMILNNQIELIKEKQKELKKAEQILSQTTGQLDDYLAIGCNKFFIEESLDSHLVTQQIRETKEVFINYITSGYYLGVIMNENSPVTPEYVYKKASGRKSSNTTRASGRYACIYQSVPNGTISKTIRSFMALIHSHSLKTSGPLYVESIANDFIKFPNQENIFKLQIRLAQ